MITNIMHTIQRTFLDGFDPKPLAVLPTKARREEAFVSAAVPEFNGRFCDQEVTRLATSEEHRAILREAFLKARKKLVIVSPFITLPAVRADRIAELVKGAVGRGVEVVIYTDDRLNLAAAGQVKETCRTALAVLADAGATVKFARAIHNKTLCIDDQAIVEGSYNWLSAVRDGRSRNQRQECSIVYCGKGVGKMIKDAVSEISLAS